jgi:hypothetical protein
MPNDPFNTLTPCPAAQHLGKCAPTDFCKELYGCTGQSGFEYVDRKFLSRPLINSYDVLRLAFQKLEEEPEDHNYEYPDY